MLMSYRIWVPGMGLLSHLCSYLFLLNNTTILHIFLFTSAGACVSLTPIVFCYL